MFYTFLYSDRFESPQRASCKTLDFDFMPLNAKE